MKDRNATIRQEIFHPRLQPHPGLVVAVRVRVDEQEFQLVPPSSVEVFSSDLDEFAINTNQTTCDINGIGCDDPTSPLARCV